MKDIIGYEGLYKIDEYGKRIESMPIKYKKGGIIKTYKNTNGYIIAYLSKNGITKTIKVHRLVAIAYIPNPFNLPKVNHLDGNKENNHYKNLEWSTQKRNIQHAFETGLSNQSGFRNNAGKIKDLDTLTKIREEWVNNPQSQASLAKKYSVSQGTISNILSGKSYGMAIDATTLKTNV